MVCDKTGGRTPDLNWEMVAYQIVVTDEVDLCFVVVRTAHNVSILDLHVLWIRQTTFIVYLSEEELMVVRLVCVFMYIKLLQDFVK